MRRSTDPVVCKYLNKIEQLLYYDLNVSQIFKFISKQGQSMYPQINLNEEVVAVNKTILNMLLHWCKHIYSYGKTTHTYP